MRRSQYIYPALYPAAGLNLADQFAFRPSGSTTAAIVALFHEVYAHSMGMCGTATRRRGREGSDILSTVLSCKNKIILCKKTTQDLCKNNTRLVILVTQAGVSYCRTDGFVLLEQYMRLVCDLTQACVHLTQDF